MATPAIRSYSTSFSSLRGWTRKTIGAWQDPDTGSPRRQQFIPHSRNAHTSSTRPQYAGQQSDDSRIAGSLRQWRQSYGLQYAKFHGHLEKLTRSGAATCPQFESHQVPQWTAKAYRAINWAMKLEPVLRQMADGLNFEFRPTALLLFLASNGHAPKYNIAALGLSEVAYRLAAVSSDRAETVDTAGTLTALLEELCLELAEFRAELCNAMESLHGGEVVRRVQKNTASRSIVGSVTQDYRSAKGALYGQDTRPYAWSRLPKPHANFQRASIHSFSFDGRPRTLKFGADQLEMVLFGHPLDMSAWCCKSLLMADIRAFATLDASNKEDDCLCCEDADQERRGESCDTCNPLESRPRDHTLSPYIQMFGQIRFQDVLQFATRNPCRHSVSQQSEPASLVSGRIESSNPEIPMKTFSNNSISGSARVHLGDLYYENVTINQYYVLKGFDEPVIERFATLDSMARSCNHIT